MIKFELDINENEKIKFEYDGYNLTFDDKRIYEFQDEIKGIFNMVNLILINSSGSEFARIKENKS